MGIWRRTFMSAILIIASPGVWAQSNDVVDTLLGQKQAAMALTVYMAAVGGNWIPETSSPADALTWAIGQGWLAAGT